MAAVWLSLNEGKKALAANQEASEKWHAAGDSKEEVNALLATGVVYNWLGDRQNALTVDQQALQLANENGLSVSSVRRLVPYRRNLSVFGQKNAKLSRILLAAQERSKSVDYPDGDGKVLALIGFTYASLGDQKASNLNIISWPSQNLDAPLPQIFVFLI